MVSLDDETKARFDELRPEECDTQSEFVDLLLDCYELTDDDGMAELRTVLDRMDELEQRLGAKAELGAYRGVSDALETIEIDPEE